LIPHRWLQDGHSRWYFRCGDLREVRLRIAQPTRLPALAGQRMRVCLNEQVVLEASIEPEHERIFTIRPPVVDIDFHRLDVMASATARSQGETLSLQVRALTIVDGQGRALHLIE
jgi:hypothetical protein